MNVSGSRRPRIQSVACRLPGILPKARDWVCGSFDKAAGDLPHRDQAVDHFHKLFAPEIRTYAGISRSWQGNDRGRTHFGFIDPAAASNNVASQQEGLPKAGPPPNAAITSSRMSVSNV